MDSHHLRAMMNGDHKSGKAKVTSNKSKTKHELEHAIDDYVDGLDVEHPNQTLMQSPKDKREKIRLELKEAAKVPDLSKNLETAMEILFSEGPIYLSQEAYKTLINDFSHALTLLGEQKFNDTTNVNLHEVIKISNESMNSIATIAITKFSEGQYPHSMALFSLLTGLNPSFAEYWFRLGIAAQKCDNHEMALRVYEAALALDPNLIGARLFSAESHAKLKHFKEAAHEIAEAKKIAEHNQIDSMWLEMIPIIERTIK